MAKFKITGLPKAQTGGTSGCPDGQYFNGTDCVAIPKGTTVVYTQEEYDRLNTIKKEQQRLYNEYIQRMNARNAITKALKQKHGNYESSEKFYKTFESIPRSGFSPLMSYGPATLVPNGLGEGIPSMKESMIDFKKWQAIMNQSGVKPIGFRGHPGGGHFYPVYEKPSNYILGYEKPNEDIRLPLKPIDSGIPISANEITSLNLSVPKINQATTIEAEDVSTKMPIYKNEPVYGQRSDGSWYIKEYKKVIVGYENVGGKNYKRVPFELRPYQKGGQLQPGYYKYKHKPEASYKFDGNQWYISNEGTKGNYKPIEDPKGTRSKTLAKGLEYGTTQFYAPLAENVQGQTTTFPQVSQKSIQASQQNLDAEKATQQQAVDNLNEYYNRKRNQTSYNIHDLPEEKGWYYNEGETLKGVANDYLGDTDTQVDKATALSGDAEDVVQYIMSDPNYGLPNNSQGLRMARDMVKNWTPQQIEQFVTERREAYMESQRGEIKTPSKSTVSFSAPENPTLADYAGRVWDITMNPIDAFTWSVSGGGLENMPWNMRQYENAKAATGSTDITDNNLVGNAIDFLSYFTGVGLIGHGIKQLPQTNESVNRLMEDPSWENAGTAAMDVGTNIMMLSPLGRFTGRGFNPRNFRTNVNNVKFQAPSRTDMVDAALNIDPRAQETDIATAFNTVTMANDLRPGKRTSDNNVSVGTNNPSSITWPWSGKGNKSGHYNDPNRQLALADLQTRTLSNSNNLGNDAAKTAFEKLKQERIALADTPEGRRRIQKHIDDNEIGDNVWDSGNEPQLKAFIEDRLTNHIPNGTYEKEDYEMLDAIKNWGITKRMDSQADAWFSNTDWGGKKWSELTMDDLKTLDPSDIDLFAQFAAEAHPNNTAGFINTKMTVDEYIDSMKQAEYSPGYDKEQMLYDLHEKELKPARASLALEEDILKNMINNPNHYDAIDIQNQNDLLVLISQDIDDLLVKEADINAKFPDDNAYYAGEYFTGNTPNIWIGRDFRGANDLGPTLDHEYGHFTDLIKKSHFNYHAYNRERNSKMARDLINELELENTKMPKHLEQIIKPEDIENEVGYNASNLGLKKALNPPAYWANAKNYFLHGSYGDSPEPVAFLAEVRKFMLDDGMIKSIHDPVTPQMIEQAYRKYIKKPLYAVDLRLFDIIKDKSNNFKVLSKHMNNLQVLAPYLVGAGAIGTMLSGSGEEEEPEMKMGGIVIDLDQGSIDDYINRGYIVVEE